MVLFFAIEIKNDRFWLNDFRVMHDAADAYIHQRSVYGEPFGLATGYYKYSPFTLLFFIVTLVFPYFYAALIHATFIGLATCIVFGISRLVLFEDMSKKIPFRVFFVGFLIIVTHWIREVHLGNINLILLSLLLAALYFYKNNRWIPASFLVAIAILTKPYFLVLALPFLFQKKFQFVLTTAIAIGICVLISLSLLWGNGLALYSDWFTAMTEHSNYLKSDQTIFAIFHNISGVETSNMITYIIFLTAVVGSCFIYFTPGIKKFDMQKVLSFHVLILIAVIPNFLITDTEHFLFSTPLIFYCLIQLWHQKNWTYGILFFIIAVLYGFHSTDILGKELALRIINYGVLGIGNMLIIAISIFLFYKRERLAV